MSGVYKLSDKKKARQTAPGYIFIPDESARNQFGEAIKGLLIEGMGADDEFSMVRDQGSSPA